MSSLDPAPGRYAVRDGVLHRRSRQPLRSGLAALVTVIGLGAAVAGQFLVVRPAVQNRLQENAIAALADYGYPQVAVAVHGRDVELTGVPDDPAQIAMVARIVREVPGVNAVRTMAVAGPGPASATPPSAPTPAVTTASAPAVARSVSAPLAPLADLAAVGAIVDSGTVVLFGSVPSEAGRNRLVDAVRGAFGAGAVDDRMSVEPTSGGYGLDGFARVLLAMGRDTRAGAVSLRTGRMRVAGVIAEEAVRTAVRQAAALSIGSDAGALTDTMTVVAPGARVTDKQVAAQVTALPAITFATRSADIRPASRPVLEAAAALLLAHSAVLVQVEGHTDASGLAEANRTLSLERANAVVAVLRKAGVPARRLTARGFGSARKIAPGKGDLVDALNRRVVLVATAG
jgi:outer membrane protein OmpA-like peptidoglycan-associated protein/osmotically-inducible protein OsmY